MVSGNGEEMKKNKINCKVMSEYAGHNKIFISDLHKVTDNIDGYLARMFNSDKEKIINTLLYLRLTQSYGDAGKISI